MSKACAGNTRWQKAKIVEAQGVYGLGIGSFIDAILKTGKVLIRSYFSWHNDFKRVMDCNRFTKIRSVLKFRSGTIPKVMDQLWMVQPLLQRSQQRMTEISAPMWVIALKENTLVKNGADRCEVVCKEQNGRIRDPVPCLCRVVQELSIPTVGQSIWQRARPHPAQKRQ